MKLLKDETTPCGKDQGIWPWLCHGSAAMPRICGLNRPICPDLLAQVLSSWRGSFMYCFFLFLLWNSKRLDFNIGLQFESILGSSKNTWPSWNLWNYPKIAIFNFFLILICPSPCIICIRDQTTGKKQYFIYKPSRKMWYEIQNWCILRGSSSMLKLAYGMLEPISFRFRDIPHYPQSSWTGVGGSLVTGLFSMSVR